MAQDLYPSLLKGQISRKKNKAREKENLINWLTKIGYQTIKVDGNRWELNTFFVEWQSLMASGSENSDNPLKKIKIIIIIKMINYWMRPKYLQYLKRYTLHCGIKTPHKKNICRHTR